MFYLTSLKIFWKSNETITKKIKSLFFFIYHRQWINHIHTNFTRDNIAYILDLYPYILYKVRLRCFSYKGSPSRDIANRLLGHYHVLARVLSHSEIRDLFHKGLLVWSTRINGCELKLVLSKLYGKAYEGELTLRLMLDEHVVQRTCIHFYQRSIWVGGIQGGKDSDQLALNKTLTKITHGIRPQNFIYLALCALAKRFDLVDIYGVSSDYHMYQYKRSGQKKVRFNYSGFWSELNGEKMAGAIWYKLPLTYPRKSMDDLPSKKRSLYRKRYAFMDQFEKDMMIADCKALDNLF